jgi:hypothetical protein
MGRSTERKALMSFLAIFSRVVQRSKGVLDCRFHILSNRFTNRQTQPVIALSMTNTLISRKFIINENEAKGGVAPC